MNEDVENWRDIVGYENLYQVSNFGNVKNCLSGRILKLLNDKDGYKLINLHKNGVQKTYKVHRLVGQAFLPNPNNLPCINHKDEDKTNNRVSNLEWCTIFYNNHYATRKERVSKALTNRKDQSKPVLQYDKNGNYLNEYLSIKDAERHTGINNSYISRVCRGKEKSAGGYLWRYKDD